MIEHQFISLPGLAHLKNNGLILVAHSGRVFDFCVVSYAVERTGLQIMFLENVSKFTDSLSLI